MRTIRRVLVALLVIAVSFTASAQKVTTSVGASFITPVHNLESTTFGVGVDVTSAYGIAKDLGVTLSSGYNWLYQEGSGNVQVLPVKAGLKYYANPKFYLAGAAGVSFFTQNGGNLFTYSGALGYQANKKVDVSARWEGWNKESNGNGMIGVRIGYSL